VEADPGNRNQRRYLTDEEVRNLLSAIPTDRPSGLRNLAIVALMLECGLKVSELVGKEKDDGEGRRTRGGLRIEDLDWSRKKISVTKPRDGTTREVRISDEVLGILDRWLQVRPNGDTSLVFTTMEGGRIQNRYVRHFLSEYGNRAGIVGAVKPSLLRHTFAGRVFHESGDIELLRELLGHRNISTTARYAHRRDTFGKHAGGEET